MKFLKSMGLIAATMMIGAGAAQAASVTVTYENPGVEHSTGTFTTVGVENFDSRSNGAFSTDFGLAPGVITGQYSAATQILNADQYGGAGGAGRYAVTFSNAGYALNLSTSLPTGVTYFGYWLPALDNGNVVELYSGATKIFTFTPAQVHAAIDAKANKLAYYGNPDAPRQGQNAGEAYAFVNFYSDTAFDKVVFRESPQVGGYETDNHSVGVWTARGGNGVPEPATWAMMLLGFGAIGALTRRQRALAA